MAAKPASRKKYGAEPRRQPKAPVPGWIWLLTGFALCAFIVFLMHLADMPVKTPHAVPEDTNAKIKIPAASEAAKTAEPKNEAGNTTDQKPRYDFYRLLKENQSTPSRSESTSTSPNSTPTNNEDGTYLLQVASYKTAEDADQLRAKLLLLNLNAKVETVTLRNADIWHRVLIGPIKGHDELTKTRNILNENKYEALVLKSTKE